MNLLLLYIVVIGGVFIYMTSRSNRKRQSQAAQLQSALVEGAQVRTIGGLVGEVVEVTDEHVVVETTPGVRLKFVKSAVAGVVAAAEDEDAESDEADEAEHEESALDETEHGEDEAGDEEERAEPSDEVPALASEDESEHAASEPAKR